MLIIPIPIAAVRKFRTLPRSGYFGALGRVMCSKGFGSIPFVCISFSIVSDSSMASYFLGIHLQPLHKTQSVPPKFPAHFPGLSAAVQLHFQ